MLLLALDAATNRVSLALGEGEPGARRVLAELEIPPETNSSERLPQAIPELLASAGKRLEDLAAIVVGTGPGSLTGLRVAHATGKGLAYARKIPLLGVSSLEAMAFDAPHGPELLVPVLDARRGDLYAGIFRRDGPNLLTLEPALALPAAALAERLRDVGPLRLFGPAEPLARAAFEEKGVAYASEGPHAPRAAALLQLAPAPPAFELAPLFALEPRYVRAPESEWTLKPKKPKA